MHLQLFLTLVSIPILCAWGLPVSLMTFVGNMLFAPVLTLFLLISAMLFITQLCSIPNFWLIYALEQLTICWQWATGLGSSSWLIGVPEQSLLVSLCLLLCILGILHYKKAQKRIYSTAALFCLFVGIIVGSKYTALGVEKKFMVPYGSQGIEVKIIGAGLLQLTLPKRFVLRENSIDSWLDYTMLPQITKKIGSWCSCVVRVHKNTPSVDRFMCALNQRCYTTELMLVE